MDTPNRDLKRTWRYHDATKHSDWSIRADPHYLDWANQPLPLKIYTTLDPIPLPREADQTGISALSAIAAAPVPASEEKVPAIRDLARILYFSAGITKKKTYPGGEIYFRAAACTGALYEIELYLVCGDLPDLKAGVYHFGPGDFSLRLLRAGDHRGVLVHATAAEPTVVHAPVIIVCTGTYWRNAWKYRTRTYRHFGWDNGTLLANVLAMAAALQFPAKIDMGFVDAEVNELLDLDTQREVAFSVVTLGYVSPEAPPPPREIPKLGLPTVPLSKSEVDYPELNEIHEASSLKTPEEVAEWRNCIEPSSSPPQLRRGQPRPRSASPLGRSANKGRGWGGVGQEIRSFDQHHPGASRPPSLEASPDWARASRSAEEGSAIERVILRRGSSRKFEREPIDLDQLLTILNTSTQPIWPDFPLLNDLYLIINAVNGITPGAYYFHNETGELELLQQGNFRNEARHLGLQQELPGDAAADVFFLADLESILETFGNRGYRVTQLEAGILGGKMYLASYALHLGATGLTFFDDDVTAFFSPHSSGKSAIFLVALGARRR